MVILFAEKSKPADIAKAKKILEKAGVNFILQKSGKNGAFVFPASLSQKKIEEIKKLVKVEEIFLNEKQPFLSSLRYIEKRKKIKILNWKWEEDLLFFAAGPCAIENEKVLETIAKTAKKCGAKILRGGSFKPRTSPYSFQGLGEKGLKIHRKICDKFELFMMSEVLDRSDLPLVSSYSDIIQIGSRNMQNFPLLKAAGKLKKPVLLKRNFGSTREEFLLAAEYILSEGNDKVILCERGVRGFNPAAKNVFDPASLQKLKEETWLPVVVDPSHSAGDFRYVGTIAKSAIVAGADGLMIEVHPEPQKAFSDSQQALTLSDFEKLVAELKKICQAVEKRIE